MLPPLSILLSKSAPVCINQMDNAGIHDAVWEELEELVASVGAIILRTPAYSPDLNPIEIGASADLY
eukprot:SAG22_NODE_1807_length_3531_cov_1.988636_4_plen_67_part_00